eukprot:jgi/Picsp_1/5433/NSC_02792-R1_---NA---
MLVAVPIAVSGTSWPAFAAKGAMNAQRQGKIFEIDTAWKGMIRLRVWRTHFALDVHCAKMRERFSIKRQLEGQTRLW